MKCVTPMFRVYNRDNPKVGKVISRQKAAQLLESDPNIIRKNMAKFATNYNWKHAGVQTIPCKKCWACQLNYSAEWATRIMLEAKEHPNNYFITLTYDDLHLPIAEKIETETEIYENDGTWNGTLYDHDMKKFLNSLRQYFHRKKHDGIKYFYAGEYGSTTGRPHFHIILLNCPLDPKQFYDPHIDDNFKAHWKSNEIEKFWKEGIIDICECEWSCAAYVARYCTKKISYKTDKTEYYKQGKMPEYVRMSKGIGFNYLKKNIDQIYEQDGIIMKTVQGNVGSNKPPKAFDRKLEEWNPELMEMIKKSRQTAAERADKIKQNLSDYTDLQQLNMAAEKVQKKMQMLPRVGEW